MNARETQEAIGRALQDRPTHLGLRSDFNLDVRAFADNKQLTRIDSRDWQVVLGRRGAGKTTLLATYAKHITTTLELDAASIELSVSDFSSIVQTVGRKVATDSELAQIYFSDFMDTICLHLGNVFLQGNENSKFFRLYTRSLKQRHILDLIQEIISFTQESSPTVIGAKKHAASRRSTKAESGSQKGARLGGDAELGLEGVPSAKISVGAKISVNNKRSQSDTTSESEAITYFKYDYHKVRNLISELLVALGLKKLYIFIDEWSELDKSATTLIQPHFAELLKRVFWNKEQFVIKIASVRNQTRLNAKVKDAQIGLELSADVFDIDLDYLYSSSGIIDHSFYEEMIYRHLSVCNGRLNVFQRQSDVDMLGINYAKPVETFILFIFKNRDALSTLIAGAGGLPRDFMEIFDAIGRSKKYSVETPWSVRDVKVAIRDHYVQNKISNLGTDDGPTELYERIITVISTNKDRLFAISRREQKDVLNIVADFHYKRLIHDVPLADVPARLRMKYYLYYADLGLVLDASRDLIDEAEHIDETLRTFKAEDINRYLI